MKMLHLLTGWMKEEPPVSASCTGVFPSTLKGHILFSAIS